MLAIGLRALLALCVTMPVYAAQADKITTLYDFAHSNVGDPTGPLTYHAGAIYGTTAAGGPSGTGIVYKFDFATGQEATLYGFSGQDQDGEEPSTGIIYHDGLLYGTTSIGGINGAGTVFTVDPNSGAEQVVYAFAGGADGKSPTSALNYQKGAFYGVTGQGGANDQGTLFVLDPKTNNEKVLYDFGGGADGGEPAGNLVYQSGYFYGAASNGGNFDKGAIFSFDLKTQREKLVYSFQGGILNDGASPQAAVLYENGLLYGSTSEGGNTLCGGTGCGTIFQIDPTSGAETVLYRFSGKHDGAAPATALTYVDGVLYGSTGSGGKGYGTLFAFDLAAGTMTTVYQCTLRNGAIPSSPLLYLDHRLYGTFANGATENAGVIFNLSP